MEEKNQYEEDEITLKELILKLQEYFWYVLKNWKIVVLLVVPLVAFMLYKAFTTPPVYNAKLTFMVDEDEGNSMGGISSILGNFGFGGGGKGKYNLDKILELAKSNKIINSVLMGKVSIDGREDYVANILIQEYEFHEAWKDSKLDGLPGLLFHRDSIPLFNQAENAALKAVYNKVIGTKDIAGLLTTGYNEDSGIMSIRFNSVSEPLSIWFSTILYDKLSNYYVSKTIEKQQNTYDVVKAKKDSIAVLLQSKEYELAKFKDRNRNLLSKTDALRELRLQRDVQMLTLMYGETIKNLEIADFSLRSKTPFIQLIDFPVSPISPIIESKLKALILGGFLGGFLAVVFLVGRKIIKDAMAEG